MKAKRMHKYFTEYPEYKNINGKKATLTIRVFCTHCNKFYDTKKAAKAHLQ
jgi:hypothetical protein